jgi:hypothetical protein
MIIYLFLLWHRPELIIGMSGKSKLQQVKKRTVSNTTDDDVVEVDGPPPQVGKSTLEKRARVADENAKAAEIIKARICSSQRYRVQKHSALWQIGKFSEYKSGVVKGNTIVCELCVESEDYLHCEITLGKDFSTTPLKNHQTTTFGLCQAITPVVNLPTCRQCS